MLFQFYFLRVPFPVLAPQCGWYLSLMMKYVSGRQQKDGFCFLILSASSCLFIGELRPLIFRINIERLVLILTILLICFLFSEFFWCASWMQKKDESCFLTQFVCVFWLGRWGHLCQELSINNVILLLWCGPPLSFELVGSDVFLASLSFCEIWSFSFAAFNIFSFFCMLSVFIAIWCEDFFSVPFYFVFSMHLAHWLAYLSLDLRKFLLWLC